MTDFGRLLIGLGLAIAAVGILVLLLAKTGLPLGHLPGDFSWRGKNSSVYFPLGICLLVSAVLSLVFYLISRFHK